MRCGPRTSPSTLTRGTETQLPTEIGELCSGVLQILLISISVVQKGTPSKEKCILVEQLYTGLVGAGLFTTTAGEHLESIAKLVATLGSELFIQRRNCPIKARRRWRQN